MEAMIITYKLKGDDSMNKHVCSLELSKQLYEAKIVTDAEYWWVKSSLQELYFITEDLRNPCHIKLCPAPIAEELLELMPEMFIDELGYYKYLKVSKVAGKYYINYNDIEQSDSKLSNACAKMLLWLKAEGYLNE